MNETYNANTYFSLLPICAGIALACYNNDSISLLGFALAMASNFCFSARAVYTKMLNSAHPNATCDINLFHALSVRGLVLLLPLGLLMEGSQVRSMLVVQHSEITMSGAYMMLLLAALNGAMFAAYNLTSYVVLRRTELVTHSVLNVFRRLFIILFTTVYFRAQLSVLATCGILLATVGVLVFGLARRNDKKEAIEDA